MSRLRPEDIRLVSDFHDFYDHHFAGSFQKDLPVYERWSDPTPRDRAEDHRLLRAAGLEAPVGRPLVDWSTDAALVAYTDPCAHRGAGKLRGTIGELRAKGVHPEAHAVLWYGDPEGGRSLRLLSVGRSHYWLTYTQRAAGEWRSNVGDVEVAMAGDVMGRLYERAMEAAGRLQYALQEPLIAIDFVRVAQPHRDARWVAIDLNTAPGIRGTPVEAVDLPANPSRVVAEYIAARWGELCL